jgi:hypothetical protein
VKPKFKIGDSVKSISFFQVMMVITIIESEENLNVKYKCAWIKDGKAFSDYFNECDLIPLTTFQYR